MTCVRRGLYEAIALFLWIAALSFPAFPAAGPTGREIVAVGDVHGAFDQFSGILQRAEVIDANHHWSGKNTILVQVGDRIDRGPKPREVMDLMMALEKEAPKAGGRVVDILGNHEVMNIMGDLRYVTAENYASFADKGSEKRQHDAYSQYVKWRKRHEELLAQVKDRFPEQSEAEWMTRRPAGFVEQREAYGPTGKYGKWLRGQQAVVKLDDVIFVHGGISPSLSSMKLDDINRRIHDELAAFDNAMDFFLKQDLVLPFFTLEEIAAVVQAELASRLNAPTERHPGVKPQESLPEHTQRQIMQSFLGFGQWLSVASDGPLWFRGYSRWDETQNSSVEQLLRAYDAAHFVVGHTPQADGRIQSRLGGKIFLIDTGMLASYYPQGKASALEILAAKKFTAQYQDQEVVLLDLTQPSSSDRVPAGAVAPAASFLVTGQLHP